VNGLLANQMFRLGRLAGDLEAEGRRLAAERIDAMAIELAAARDDGSQVLALERLHQLAEQLANETLLDIWCSLTQTPVPA